MASRFLDNVGTTVRINALKKTVSRSTNERCTKRRPWALIVCSGLAICNSQAASASVSMPQNLVKESNDSGLALLKAMRSQSQDGTAFEGTIQSFSEGSYQNGERMDHITQHTSVMHFWWRRPNQLRVEIVQSDAAFSRGVTLVTNDLITCHVRAGGMLSFLQTSLDVQDLRLRNNRNYTLRETNPKSYLDRTIAKGAVWKAIGEGSVVGVPVQEVEVSGVRALDATISREVLEIDPKARALRRARLFEGNRLVASYTMTAFRWLPALSDENFKN